MLQRKIAGGRRSFEEERRGAAGKEEEEKKKLETHELRQEQMLQCTSNRDAVDDQHNLLKQRIAKIKETEAKHCSKKKRISMRGSSGRGVSSPLRIALEGK